MDISHDEVDRILALLNEIKRQDVPLPPVRPAPQAAAPARLAPHIQNFRIVLVNRSTEDPALFEVEEVENALRSHYWGMPWDDIEVEVIKTYDNNHDFDDNEYDEPRFGADHLWSDDVDA